MNKTEHIKKVLQSGEYIRVIDGRYTEGFVNTDTLNSMIKAHKIIVDDVLGTRMATRYIGE